MRALLARLGTGPFPSVATRGVVAGRLLAVREGIPDARERTERLGRWLRASEGPMHILLLADLLPPQEVHPLGPEEGSASDEDFGRLAFDLARAGMVGRRMVLVVPGRGAAYTDQALAEAGLGAVVMGVAERASLGGRLLSGEPPERRGPPLSRLASTPDGAWPGTAGGTSPGVGRGQRTLADLALPDGLVVHPDRISGPSGSAVLLYLDGLARDLPAEGLANALVSADAVDVSIRLWPLESETVIRHLTRRLRDLRASRVQSGTGEGDFRVDTAVSDAEELREALYLGQTRMVQASIVLCARGSDDVAARASADTIRLGLARLGFLPRLAFLRQWEALVSMLPGAPDRLGAVHNLTSEGAARLVPSGLVAPSPAGLLLGQDRATRAPVYLDRTRLANPAAVYLGAPGSGKSSLAKMEVLRRAKVAPADRFLVIDPEGEYGRVVAAVPGGLEIDAARPGALRLPLLSGLSDLPPGLRALRAASLLAPLLDAGENDRQLLGDAIEQGIGSGQEDLVGVPERLGPAAAGLARRLRAALNGPLALFAGTSAPGPAVRALSLNLRSVDSTLLPALLPALTETAIGLLEPAARASRGLVWLTLDEFHLFLAHQEGARLLLEMAKRARKRGLVLTAVTQHVVDLLRHPDGRAILAAVELVALFRPGVDLEPFAELFDLSEPERRTVSTLAPGEALVRTPSRTSWVRVALSERETALADTRPAAVVRGRVDHAPLV